MPDINECRISWLKAFGKETGCLRVQHMPSGYEVERQDIGTRDDWGMDELLSQLDVMIELNPIAPKYRR